MISICILFVGNLLKDKLCFYKNYNLENRDKVYF